jgi:ribosomal protein S3
LAATINFLTNYFSTILSNLVTCFWLKLKETTGSSISIGIRFLDNFSVINPQFLARFIARRVTYGFQLQRVIKPLIKDLLVAISRRKNKIIGFRIACSGRFDRKQIASYVWQKFGPVPLNKFSCNINYGFSTAFLKYGTCGIKV